MSHFLQLMGNWSWEEINPVFVVKLTLNLIAVGILSWLIYLKHHKRSDLILTFYVFCIQYHRIPDQLFAQSCRPEYGCCFWTICYFFHVALSDRRNICAGYDLLVFIHCYWTHYGSEYRHIF